MTDALHVEGLSVLSGDVALVDEVSVTLEPGRLHAMVGESGSGKSMTAFGLIGLTPPGMRVTGQVRWGSANWVQNTPADWQRLRGRVISMMLQEPLSALNPVLRAGAQVLEAVQAHHPDWAPAQARARALELLHEVGLADAEQRWSAYPHELSGGLRQRVLLAASLAGAPRVLIADEPTTALDAHLRNVVIDLFADLARRRNMAVLVLTHDFRVVHACDDLTVMYAGRAVEQGLVKDRLANPRHPYTQALLRAVPGHAPRGQPLEALPGQAPSPSDWVDGCRFRPRCARADDACRVRPEVRDGTACHHPR